MRIDKGQISTKKFIFSIICYIQASAMLTSFITAIVYQDSWLVILFGMIVCVPLIWLFNSLMVAFPDMNLIQILNKVYGPVAGKVIGAGYIWFFLTLSSLNLMDLGDFTKLTFMDEMPLLVLALMCVIVTSMVVRKGIKAVAWYSSMFVVVAVAILVISILLLLNQMHYENFLPTLHLSVLDYVQGTHIILTIPFGELVAFLMITPNVKISRENNRKHLFTGFIVGGLTILFAVVRDVAVLGNTIDMFTLPSLVVIRLVRLGEALSRMEILFAIVLIILLFFKIVFLQYVTVIALAQLFNITSFRYLALSVGALMVAYGMTLYPNVVVHAASGREIIPFLWTLFEILIPLLTFIIAKARKLPGKKEAR